jgi:hypothetical protein
MVKANYMNDDEMDYNNERAEAMKQLLKKVLGKLIEKISV